MFRPAYHTEETQMIFVWYRNWKQINNFNDISFTINSVMEVVFLSVNKKIQNLNQKSWFDFVGDWMQIQAWNICYYCESICNISANDVRTALQGVCAPGALTVRLYFW